MFDVRSLKLLNQSRSCNLVLLYLQSIKIILVEGLTSNLKLRTSKVQKARVAKLVDALSSGGSIRKVVLVRIRSRAQNKKSLCKSTITKALFIIPGLDYRTFFCFIKKADFISFRIQGICCALHNAQFVPYSLRISYPLEKSQNPLLHLFSCAVDWLSSVMAISQAEGSSE